MTDPKWTYDDIVSLPAPDSKAHQKMARQDRAAQFMPFAALTGYGDVIQEVSRLTGVREDLDEGRLLELNEALSAVLDILPQSVPAHVRYFEKDARKEGGEYIEKDVVIRNVDLISRTVRLSDDTTIMLDDLYSLAIR